MPLRSAGPLERRLRRVDAADDARRHAGGGAAGRHGFQHHAAGGDLGARAELDVAQYSCASAQQLAAPHFQAAVAALLASCRGGGIQGMAKLVVAGGVADSKATRLGIDVAINLV
jgi:hypothetical protein